MCRRKGIKYLKSKVKYWTCTHKYGVRIPKSVKEAIEIDKPNGNTRWWEAIVKDMRLIFDYI